MTKFNILTSSRFIAFLIFIFLNLLLTGCWSNQDINDLAIINVLGIDQNKAGEYVVSTVIANPGEKDPSSQNDGSGDTVLSSSLIKTGTGSSIHEALGKLSTSISKRIYLGHVNNIIFSEKVAVNGMEDSLDYFRRENDFRPNIRLLVTKGTAADVLKIKPQLAANLGFAIHGYYNENRYAPINMERDISQFMKMLSSNTVDPITAEIGIINNVKKPVNQEKTSAPTSAENKDNQYVEPDIDMKGTAVFKGGSLVGWLDERETRGLLWVKGEADTGIIVVSCDEKDSGTVTLGLGKSNSQLIPHITKGEIDMTVKIQVNAEIRNVTCQNLKMSSSQIDRLNKRIEKLVKQEVLTVIMKAKNHWQTDIFGFGEVIYRKDPKKWDQISKNWRTSGLRKMGVQVKVKSNISRYGLQEDPSKANESR